MLLSDIDAIADSPDRVYAAIDRHAGDTDSLQAWIRNLTKLRRYVSSHRRARITVADVDRYLTHARGLLDTASDAH